MNRIIPTILGQETFKEEAILISIRLPRILIIVLAGMALTLSVGILQGDHQKRPGRPGIIGINAGAGVGVAIYYLFFPIDAGSFSYLLPFISFISPLLTADVIYFFSYSKQTGLQPLLSPLLVALPL